MPYLAREPIHHENDAGTFRFDVGEEVTGLHEPAHDALVEQGILVKVKAAEVRAMAEELRRAWAERTVVR